MISEQEARHIAKLARIAITKKEVKKLQKELSAILDYIKKLNEVDVTRIEINSSFQLLKNIMRKDNAEKADIEQINKLIELAPDKKRGYIKVKTVF